MLFLEAGLQQFLFLKCHVFWLWCLLCFLIFSIQESRNRGTHFFFSREEGWVEWVLWRQNSKVYDTDHEYEITESDAEWFFWNRTTSNYFYHFKISTILYRFSQLSILKTSCLLIVGTLMQATSHQEMSKTEQLIQWFNIYHQLVDFWILSP